MKQFEYKYFTSTPTILGVTDWLNSLGTQGWQCVYLDLTTTVGHVYGYFMRELKQQE